MAERLYVYVDGESHYIRSQEAWKRIYGEEATLDCLRCASDAGDALVLVDEKAKLFWTRRMLPGAYRAYYFTAAVGGSDIQYDLQRKMKDFDLEATIIQEKADQAARRKQTLDGQRLIEKAKGVDIALTVRMMEDAQQGAFDECHLFSSDLDYLPLIKSVRAKGKKVFLHGFDVGLGKDSPLLCEVDSFTEMEEVLRKEYQFIRPK